MHKKLLKTLNSTDNTLYRIFFWFPDLLQKLAFGCTGISNDANVDVTTEIGLLQSDFGNSSKQHEKDPSLHLFITYNTFKWCDLNRHICLHESQGNVYTQKIYQIK